MLSQVAVLTVEVVVNRGVVNVAVYEAADDNKENQKSSLQVSLSLLLSL